MTLIEAVSRVNTVAWYMCNGMEFPVDVEDVKKAYGNFRYLIRPVNGSGSKWVDEYNLSFTDLSK